MTDEFPKERKFVVLFNTRFYHRTISLSGGIIAVSSQDNEYLLQEFTPATITFKLVHESGRYEHKERISKKSSITVSLMYWELDDFVKWGLWREKEVIAEETK